MSSLNPLTFWSTWINSCLLYTSDAADDVEYAIFAGQNACGKDAFAYYPAFFKKITGKEVKIFFVNPTRKRSSARPIYNELFQEDFKLDTTVYNEFINWLN